MKYATSFLVVVAACLLLGPNALAEDTPDYYKSKCVMCHGADGSGSTAMGEKLGVRDLRSDDVQKQSDEQLLEIMAKGKGKMPAYEGKLPDDALKQLVARIRSLKK